MEQKDSVRRGRPQQFDRDTVVDGALHAFWSSGYDLTSLSTLEAATGVDRSTLYNSFGGKSGLYETAAARYVDNVSTFVCEPIASPAGLGAVLSFLDRLDEVTASTEYPHGCFIVNDLASDAHDRAATDRYLAQLRDGFDAALQAGGVDDDSVRGERAAALTAIVLGVNAAANHDTATARAMIDGARSIVRSWEDERQR